MAEGVLLSEMLDMLRAETGQSLAPAHQVAQRDPQTYLLRRVQEELANEFDWPTLKVSRDVTLLPGEAAYELPEDMDFAFVNRALTDYGSEWIPVVYGIEPEHYSGYGETYQSWPIGRWSIEPDETRQFKVWPVPSQTGTIKFVGRKKLAPLVAMTDKSTLDATAIVLFAAAEVRAASKGEDAALKLDKARNYLRRLKARVSSNKEAPIVMGSGGRRGPTLRPGIDYIPEGYGSG